MENIKERIKEIISKVLEIKITKIKSNSHLTNDLKIDSLDIIEVIMALEEEFQIEIPDEDIESFKTIESIMHYIKKKSE